MTARSMRVRQWLAYGATLLAVLGVFALYLQPDFIVTLSQQIWACL